MTLPLSQLAAVALPAGLAAAGFVLGLFLQHVVLGRLARAARRTRSAADDIVVAAVRGPLVLWGTVIGLYVGMQFTELPSRVGHLAERGLIALLIASITWALARLAGNLAHLRAQAAPGMIPSTNLITNLVRAAVLALGGLVVLDTLGISIAPLLTALGVGGLAVGLALQDTLANLFAGIHILLSRQVRPGDFIRLSSGEEGYVEDIAWRYTTIRQLPNNLTIVPNSKLASAVTANFTLPDPEQAVLLEVAVSYGSDLEHVERVTVDVGREVMREVEGGVPAFSPFIRYHTFGDSSIQFTVILRARDYVSQYLVKHEFIKRLHERYRREGIEIPFPIRTVHLHRMPPGAGGEPQAQERDTRADAAGHG
jgi:small-conductance mechanosensitive channel